MTNPEDFAQPVQPILVVLVWRGGDRFRRALESIAQAEKYFQRIVLSVTATLDSQDLKLAQEFRDSAARRNVGLSVEVICSEVELPTMLHQRFWINYLQKSGAADNDWIFWLAYDDELRQRGLQELVDENFNWPLISGYSYFGPWAMRHEDADELWSGNPNQDLETWTAFPLNGPKTLEPLAWSIGQLLQPTYMQMSGSVMQLSCHEALVSGIFRKRLPMRIELASAINSNTVSEFPVPLVRIYGRPNSDRANYGNSARREDLDLVVRIIRREFRHPISFLRSLRSAWHLSSRSTGKLLRRDEEWRVSGSCAP